jgi:hypothetical protein
MSRRRWGCRWRTADRRDQRQRHPPPRAFDSGDYSTGDGDRHRRAFAWISRSARTSSACCSTPILPRRRFACRSDAWVRGGAGRCSLTNAQQTDAALPHCSASDRIDSDDDERRRCAGLAPIRPARCSIRTARSASPPRAAPDSRRRYQVVTLATAHPSKFRRGGRACHGHASAILPSRDRRLART